MCNCGTRRKVGLGEKPLQTSHLPQIQSFDPVVAIKTHPSEMMFCHVFNPHLKSGHRMGYLTPSDCLWSWFQLHNETLNIWSHFLSAIYFAYLWVDCYQQGKPGDPFQPWRLVIATACFFCFVASVGYHTFRCMSDPDLLRWLRMDYCGIATHIVGVVNACFYVAFYCTQALKIGYISTFGILIGMSVMCATGFIPDFLSDFLQRMLGGHKWMDVAMRMLALSVTFCVLPFLHWLSTAYPEEISLSLFNISTLFAIYGIGFSIFMAFIPERFFRGPMPLQSTINSHSIWHLIVTFAALWSWKTFDLYAEYRTLHPCHDN